MENLAEMLAGAGLAAKFAADPAIWETFTQWTLEKGYATEEERLLFSREGMALSSLTLYSVIKEVQDILSASPEGKQLPALRLPYVARTCGVHGNER